MYKKVELFEYLPMAAVLVLMVRFLVPVVGNFLPIEEAFREYGKKYRFLVIDKCLLLVYI